jgi:hypothetical protein
MQAVRPLSEAAEQRLHANPSGATARRQQMGLRQQQEVERGGSNRALIFLYGAPKNHDHHGLSIFCMDKR